MMHGQKNIKKLCLYSSHSFSLRNNYAF